MAVYRLTGQDTIKVNERLLTDFPNGDIAKVSFSTDLVTVKTGKNGNAIYASNESGNQATLELKVLRGSDDDKFLNSLLLSYKNSPATFALMTAELIKRMGDGAGNVINDTYILAGGAFTKLVEGMSNVEGNTDQAISTYTMQFATAPRAIA